MQRVPEQAATPGAQLTPDQGAPKAMSTPRGFFMSATPLEEQRQRALLQVLQEEVRPPSRHSSQCLFSHPALENMLPQTTCASSNLSWWFLDQ